MRYFLEGGLTLKSALNKILSEVQKVNPSAKSVTNLFSSRRDGWNRLTMYDKTFGHLETIVLIKTNYHKIVGAYMPDQWFQAE